ncbi:MAG: FAD-dependent oxidoreductase, partial [Planctomycetota bacterium JB042]
EHVVDALVEASRSLGIEVRLDHEVRAVEADGDGERVTATCGAETVRFDADLVVHGAGRAPNVESLALEVPGIAPTDRGLPVDDRARCIGAPHVLAGGDVADAGHPKLLRVASHHASVISSALRGEEDGPTLEDVVPVAVVFTAPRLAGIGLTERAARERGHSVRVRTEPEKTWKLLRESNARAFAFKTIVDDETDRILGAFVLAPGAEALIDLIALAIDADLPADALKRPLYGYPALGGHVGAMIP